MSSQRLLFFNQGCDKSLRGEMSLPRCAKVVVKKINISDTNPFTNPTETVNTTHCGAFKSERDHKTHVG